MLRVPEGPKAPRQGFVFSFHCADSGWWRKVQSKGYILEARAPGNLLMKVLQGFQRFWKFPVQVIRRRPNSSVPSEGGMLRFGKHTPLVKEKIKKNSGPPRLYFLSQSHFALGIAWYGLPN